MEKRLADDKLYHFYQDATFSLARSIIIKNSVVAKTMNEVVEYGYHATQGTRPEFYVNPNDPASWRYYKHLAGEYHPIDKPMKITSLDTLQQIDFTKENMALHRATWRDYNSRGDYYRKLVERFPDQELLIQGILNPIDKQFAIDADEYTILYYDKQYVNKNEFFLMSDLQKKITGYLERWDVSGYSLTEDLFEPSRIAILYMFIPSMLMNIRLKYAKTMYAHEYHIWNYLGSRLGLDRFKQYFTDEQAMWLYLNIDWVMANAGKTETYKDLIHYIMSLRKLPVSRYLSSRDVSEVMKFDYDVSFRREQLNLPELEYKGREDESSLKLLMEKELDTALDNEIVMASLHDARLASLKFGLRDNLNTKVIESHVIDYSNQELFPLEWTMMDYWIYMTMEGRYESIISVTNPYNNELIAMDTKEALVAFLYCSGKAFGLETDKVPVGRVQASDIYFPVIQNWDFIEKKLDAREHYEPYLRYIKDTYPGMERIVSTEGFNRFCKRINRFKMRMHDLWGLTEDLALMGEINMMTESIKADYSFALTEEPMTFLAYVQNKGWAITQMEKPQYGELATDIFLKITGLDLSQVDSIDDIQSAMIRVMEKLLSYHVHFVKTLNRQDVILLDPPALRAGLIEQQHYVVKHIMKGFPNVIDARYHTAQSTPLDMTSLGFGEDVTPRASERQSHEWETPVEFRQAGANIKRRRIPINTKPFVGFEITSNKQEPDYLYWVRNGSLYVDRYYFRDKLTNTLDLEDLKGTTWLGYTKDYALQRAEPTAFDKLHFREQYGDRPWEVIHPDGSLGLLNDPNWEGIYLHDAEYVQTTLDGLEWTHTDIQETQVPLEAAYRIFKGFNWKDTNVIVKETRPRLRDVVEEQLEGFVWEGHDIIFDTEETNFGYLIEPSLDGFDWNKETS